MHNFYVVVFGSCTGQGMNLCEIKLYKVLRLNTRDKNTVVFDRILIFYTRSSIVKHYTWPIVCSSFATF